MEQELRELRDEIRRLTETVAALSQQLSHLIPTSDPRRKPFGVARVEIGTTQVEKGKL